MAEHRIVQCPEGHYYDANRYTVCPHCRRGFEVTVVPSAEGAESREALLSDLEAIATYQRMQQAAAAASARRRPAQGAGATFIANCGDESVTTVLPSEESVTTVLPSDEPVTTILPSDEPITVVVPSDGAITTFVPSDGQMASALTGDGSVTTVVPNDGAVTTVLPSDGSVTTILPSDEPITVVVPNDGAVTTVVPSDGSVTTVLPSDGSVTTVLPSDGSVTTVLPSDGSVTTVLPSDGSVTTIWPSDTSPTAIWPSDTSPTVIWPSDTSATDVWPSDTSVTTSTSQESVRAKVESASAPASRTGSYPAPQPLPKNRFRRGGSNDTIVVGGYSSNATPDYAVGWLVAISGPCRGKDFRIHGAYNYIGRDRGQICIRGDMGISTERDSSVIYDSETGTFYVEHIMGKNVLRLNNKPVMGGSAELSPYDVIKIGNTELMFVPLCGPHFTWDGGVKHVR